MGLLEPSLTMFNGAVAMVWLDITSLLAASTQTLPFPPHSHFFSLLTMC